MSVCLRGETRRRAFTLVELLVVILIIGILAGLITTAAIGALRAAHRMTITGEISQMSMALERYKQERGDYPPDFSGIYVRTNDAARDAVLQHVRQAFPRYRPGQNPGAPASATPWELFAHDVNYATRTDIDDPNTGIKLGTDVDAIESIKRSERMTPAAAIVFWLGGVAVPGGSTTLRGFAADPMNPFAIGGARLEPFFEFNEDRLAGGFDEDGKNVFGETDVYVPYYYEPPHVRDPNGGPSAPPYVYFRARNGGYDPMVQQFPWPGDWAAGVTISWCLPYLKNYDSTNPPATISRWFSPTTYQILCCGLDGYYAEEEKDAGGNIVVWSDLLNPQQPGRQPSLVRAVQFDDQAGGGNLVPEEDDNLTNFTKGGLGDWNGGE